MAETTSELASVDTSESAGAVSAETTDIPGSSTHAASVHGSGQDAASAGGNEVTDETDGKANTSGKEMTDEERRAERRANRKRKSGWDSTPATAVPTAAAGIAAAHMAQLSALQAQAAILPLRPTAPAPPIPVPLGAAPSIPVSVPGVDGQITFGVGMPAGSVPNSRLYVGSLHYDLSEADVRAIFEPFGPITAIDLSFEPTTMKSKGFAFVEFADPAHADACQKAMDGFIVAGRPIKIGRPHNQAGAMAKPATLLGLAGVGGLSTGMIPGVTMGAFGGMGMMGMSSVVPGIGVPPGIMNFGSIPSIPQFPGTANSALTQAILQAQAAAKAQTAGVAVAPKAVAPPGPPSRIYVGSVNFDIGEDELKQVFSAFGPIRTISMIPNPESGKHKGYGFVDFEKHDSAHQAVQTMNGFDLGGRQLKVGWANSAFIPPSGSADAGQASINNIMALAAAQAAANAAVASLGGAGVQQVSVGSVASEEHISVSTAAQRAALMQKLAMSAMKVSKIVCLKNMVDHNEVDAQLEEEITDECSKYGKVEKVIIVTLEEAGKKNVRILVAFPDEASSAKAIKALDKRWFGGKVVQATYYDEAKFRRQDYTG